MPDTSRLWKIMSRIPGVFSGARIHRRALNAMHAGDYSLARQLFERAADRYRREWAVEPLARLRAHELIAHVLSLENPERASELCLQADRLLSRLDRVESLEPPFDLVDARSLLGTWARGLSLDARPPGLGADRARAA